MSRRRRIIDAIIPDRGFDGVAAHWKYLEPPGARTAIRAAVHGQELHGLTFHYSDFDRGVDDSTLKLDRRSG